MHYHDQHLSNGDYHLEEGKVQGKFIGALAEEWGFSQKGILKGDASFRAFAELDISPLSGRKLRQPRKSERHAIEYAYSAPKSVSTVAVREALSLDYPNRIGSCRGPRTEPSDQVTLPAGSSLKSGIRFSHSSIAIVISMRARWEPTHR